MNDKDEQLRQRVIELENAVYVLADALTDLSYELKRLGAATYESDALEVYHEFGKKKERNDAQN